jgi:hypothetical protein
VEVAGVSNHDGIALAGAYHLGEEGPCIDERAAGERRELGVGRVLELRIGLDGVSDQLQMTGRTSRFWRPF